MMFKKLGKVIRRYMTSGEKDSPTKCCDGGPQWGHAWSCEKADGGTGTLPATHTEYQKVNIKAGFAPNDNIMYHPDKYKELLDQLKNDEKNIPMPQEILSWNIGNHNTFIGTGEVEYQRAVADGWPPEVARAARNWLISKIFPSLQSRGMTFDTSAPQITNIYGQSVQLAILRPMTPEEKENTPREPTWLEMYREAVEASQNLTT